MDGPDMVPESWSTARSCKRQAWEFQDQLKATSGKLQAWLNNNIGYYKTMKIKKPQTDKPEEGKIYALTGVTDSKCILNGYSWKESEVKEEENEKKSKK